MFYMLEQVIDLGNSMKRNYKKILHFNYLLKMAIKRERFLQCLDRQKEILLEIEKKYKGSNWVELD